MMSSRPLYPAVKRLLDVAVALLLLGPTLVAVALAAPAALVIQGRPLLFTQPRVGRHGRPFLLMKLRTMAGPPASGRAYREGHRVTAYGRLIRHLRVDELPQVVNLLTGAMSLVGPRPLVSDHVVDAGGGGRRHDVRPGFTCYAQLELVEHGYLDRYRQVRLDEEYVDRMSLRADVAILWRTALVLFGPRRLRPPLARFEPERAGAAAVRPDSGP